jgi:glutamate decarboxylase
VKTLIVPYIRAADQAATVKSTGNLPMQDGKARNVLIREHKPEELVKKLAFSLPKEGAGSHGLLRTIEDILANSVNTWEQGFLYGGPATILL